SDETTTEAPFSTNACATPRPIPALEPVTSALLPARSIRIPHCPDAILSAHPPEFLMRSAVATILHAQRSDADRFLPEGPREHTLDRHPALAWVNIQPAADATAGDIHIRFWDGEHRTYAQQYRPGFLFPTDRANTLFVGREKEVGLL